MKAKNRNCKKITVFGRKIFLNLMSKYVINFKIKFKNVIKRVINETRNTNKYDAVSDRSCRL